MKRSRGSPTSARLKRTNRTCCLVCEWGLRNMTAAPLGRLSSEAPTVAIAELSAGELGLDWHFPARFCSNACRETWLRASNNLMFELGCGVQAQQPLLGEAESRLRRSVPWRMAASRSCAR